MSSVKAAADITDSEKGVTYKKLRFFDKDELAKMYELNDTTSKQILAGKIIPKRSKIKNQREKITQEVAIHKSLYHESIVKFWNFFEDPTNMYIVLELCKNRSMMELLQRRRVITDYECRFYVHQTLEGVKYLHDNKIIHCNLNLQNLFLNDHLNVKIGDFRQATRIEFDGQRKKKLCGTPKYMAPEMLTEAGYSFEVDIWSIGCVMYTLLVGQTPFGTETLGDTHTKKPVSVRRSAADMIIAVLESNPQKRPRVNELLTFEYFKDHHIPDSLATCCLTTAPGKRDICTKREKLVGINVHLDDNGVATFSMKYLHDACVSIANNNAEYKCDTESLLCQLTTMLNNKPKKHAHWGSNENTDPAAQPLFWVSRWVNSKYGFGYELCDGSVGIVFDNNTKMIMLGDGIHVRFVEKDGKERCMTTRSYSSEWAKRMKVLSHFKRYMIEHYARVGGAAVVQQPDAVSRVPHVHTWFVTTRALVMNLTNGSVQINFSDHIKIILCPRMSSVTHIDQNSNFRTYRFATMEKRGLTNDLYEKLRYAREQIEELLQKLV